MPAGQDSSSYPPQPTSEFDGSGIGALEAPARVERLTLPACAPSSTSRVKGEGVGYIALASRRHSVPWISTEMPFCGFRRLIEIVPRCPGPKPGRVAAVSLATDTITPMLARFSTSKEKVVSEADGLGVGTRTVLGDDDDGRAGPVVSAVVGCGEVVGAGEHAPSTAMSTATNTRISPAAPAVSAVPATKPTDPA